MTWHLDKFVCLVSCSLQCNTSTPPASSCQSNRHTLHLAEMKRNFWYSPKDIFFLLIIKKQTINYFWLQNGMTKCWTLNANTTKRDIKWHTIKDITHISTEISGSALSEVTLSLMYYSVDDENVPTWCIYAKQCPLLPSLFHICHFSVSGALWLKNYSQLNTARQYQQESENVRSLPWWSQQELTQAWCWNNFIIRLFNYCPSVPIQRITETRLKYACHHWCSDASFYDVFLPYLAVTGLNSVRMWQNNVKAFMHAHFKAKYNHKVMANGHNSSDTFYTGIFFWHT